MVRGDTVTWWPVNRIVPLRYTYFGEELEQAEYLKEGAGWEPAEFPEEEVVPNELDTEHGLIKPGEYIVHPHHGVGIFERRATQRTVDGQERHFISLQYAGNDRLLFPFERMAELMPYIGSRHPRLTRLYSQSWTNTKERIQKSLIHIARELLKIYAARQVHTRPRYLYQAEWEATLERSAGFSLTRDQEVSWQEICHDLSQSEQPMDRLLCGDVGFGKTEVAIRAAAQVAASGRQVAFMAPTTVLVEQHYAVLSDRFADLPVTVRHMSRLTSEEDKVTLEGLHNGSIDLVVGTHKLLSKHVQYKNLGLIIVDEEQKFGVAQKEQLKKLRPHLDVLSLSATPIPRTLYMSLSGLRGLSVLRTPPSGRLPIETKVQPFSDAVLKAALAAEMERGGQVYVVHNRVQSLPGVFNRVQTLLKEAGYEPEIAMAHGQMDEKALARTMGEFLRGKVRVLVASTIVEHGLDSPKANTLIVVHSERFGLSDLYQLRGRVGRRQTQAYAYFLTGGIEQPLDAEQIDPLTETARKRLRALLEASELGSGWSVAMRDLEIRGGGNILGHEQHGNMEAIGLLLYAQLLQEEIGRQAKERGITLFYKAEIRE